MSRVVKVKRVEDAYTVVLEGEEGEEDLPLITVMGLNTRGECSVQLHDSVMTMGDEYQFRHLIEAQAEAFFRARADVRELASGEPT